MRIVENSWLRNPKWNRMNPDVPAGPKRPTNYLGSRVLSANWTSIENWLLLIVTYVTKIQTLAYKYLIWFQQTAVFKKKINNDGWGFMGWFEKSYVDKRIRFLIGRLNFERHDRVHIIHCTVSVHDNILSTDVQQSLAWVGIWFWWNPLAVVQIRCGSLPDRENVWTTGLCNNAIPWNNWES